MLFRPDSDWTISLLSICPTQNNDNDDDDNLVSIISKWGLFTLIFVCFGFNNKSTFLNKGGIFTCTYTEK